MWKDRTGGGGQAALIFHIYENFSFDTSFCRFALWANFRKGFYVLRFVFEMGGGWGTELFVDPGRFFNWKIDFCWTKKLQNGREELMNGFRTNFSKNFWRPLEAGKKEFKIVLLAILSKSPSKV